MSRTILIIVGIVIIAGLGVYFIFKPKASVAPTSNNTSGTGNVVKIANFAFDPETLTIPNNTQVTWTNQDSTIHSIKSDKFNSQDLNKGDTFQFTFKEPGTFDYSCGIHPDMKGKIIVQ